MTFIEEASFDPVVAFPPGDAEAIEVLQDR
jgi:hypothetical protein